MSELIRLAIRSALLEMQLADFEFWKNQTLDVKDIKNKAQEIEDKLYNKIAGYEPKNEMEVL